MAERVTESHRRRVFVGREHELAVLTAAFEEARSGHGRLLALAGDPGIGKTTVAEMLADHARARQAEVLVGRCYDGEGVSAYWPWVHALRSYVRGHDVRSLCTQMGPGAAYIAQVVSEVRVKLPDLPPPPCHEPAQARFQFFDAITTFLINAAVARPVVIILDDLHWADIPSLLLLQFLAREMSGARLLVVGTYRDLEVGPDHPLLRVLGDLARHEHCRRIAIGGLAEVDVTRFIELTAGAAPPELAVRVHRVTGGNPLFIGEIIRLAITERGTLDPETALLQHPMPPGVRETIHRRLRGLSHECRGVLAMASAIGVEYTLNLLEHVSQQPCKCLIRAIDEARAARLVAEIPGGLGRYRFLHALVRDVLYADLSLLERADLHRGIGAALEKLHHRDLAPHLPELAHHFFLAAPGGDPSKALHYAIEAARRSVVLLGYEEAVGHYRRALQALGLTGAPDPVRRCDLLMALGDVHGKSGNVQRARQTFEEAVNLARELEDPKRLARAAIGTGQVWIEVGGVEDGLVAPIEEALAAIGEKDSRLRARLLARLAAAITYSEQRDRALELSRQAVAMARRLRDKATLAYTVSARQFTGGPDDIDERLAAARELVASTSGVDSEMVLEGRFWLAHALLERGDRPAMDRQVEAITRGAAALAHPRYVYLSAILRAMRTLLEGRLAEGERLALEAFSLGQRWSPSVATQVLTTHMFVVRNEQGRLHEMTDSLKNFSRQYPSLLGYRSGLAYLYSELGLRDDARAELELFIESDFVEVPRDLQWLSILAGLADVSASLADEASAARLYELLLPYSNRNIVTGPGGLVYGSAAHALGLLARTLCRWDEGQRHFEDALSAHRRLGAPAHLARTRLELADLLLSRGARCDGDRARKLLTQVLEVAGQIGSHRLRVKATLRLERCATEDRDKPGRTRSHEPTETASETIGRQIPSIDDVASVQPAGHEGVTGSSGIFRREGDHWAIGHDGCFFRLRDSVGLHYLAELVTHPGTEFLASDLIASAHTVVQGAASPHLTAAAMAQQGAALGRPGDGGTVLDRQARAAYHKRLADLCEERQEAQACNDPERTLRLQTEIEFLEEELTRALGLGGRERRATSDIERARVSVTRAIRAAVHKIAKIDAALASYLTTAIKTGTFCSYCSKPRHVITWTR